MNTLFITIDMHGQNKSDIKLKEQQFESIISTSILSSENEDLPVEELVDKLIKPLNINTATSDELTDLFIMSPQQIKAILDYRSKVGKFYSIYELQFIYHLDRKTIDRLVPFIYVDALSTNMDHKSKFVNQQIRHEVSTRVNFPLYKKKGDTDYFLGYPFYHNIRYSGKVNKSIEFGFTTEKDAGEPIFGGYNKWGYDYYSYYLLLKNINKFDKIILGKYRLHFGQGLILGASQFGGKWAQIQSFFNKTTDIKKHSSVSEYDYFRGIAFIYKNKGFAILPFYSNHCLDGHITDDGIKSISKTGQHRSVKDFQKKNTVKENILGIRLSYSNTKFEIGLNGIYYFFNRPLLKSNLAYKANDIQGNNFYNGSVDYTIFLNHFILKGEIAKGVRGMALLQKLYYSPLSALDVLFIYRYYTPDYWAFHSRSFGNQSSVKNENGFYLNIQSSYFSSLKINTYVDFCTYAKSRYRISKPSKSLYMGIELDYDLNKQHHFLLRFSIFNTIKDVPKSKPKIQTIYQSMKIRGEYALSLFNEFLLLKTFGEYGLLKNGRHESGYHISQRLTYYLGKIKTAIQYSYINGSSFENRFYIYEPNMLYNSYIPSFYGKGHRLSCLFQYKITHNVSLNFKYGCIYYTDRNIIGSGYDEIVGHQKSDLEFMARIKF